MLARLIRMLSPSVGVLGRCGGAGRPALGDGPQRRRVQVVELVAALAAGPHQPRRLEDVQVLRDRLPGRADLVPADQPGAQLEQRLAVPLLEFVEESAAGGIRERLVDVTASGSHRTTSPTKRTIGK